MCSTDILCCILFELLVKVSRNCRTYIVNKRSLFERLVCNKQVVNLHRCNQSIVRSNSSVTLRNLSSYERTVTSLQVGFDSLKVGSERYGENAILVSVLICLEQIVCFAIFRGSDISTSTSLKTSHRLQQFSNIAIEADGRIAQINSRRIHMIHSSTNARQYLCLTRKLKECERSIAFFINNSRVRKHLDSLYTTVVSIWFQHKA